MTSKFAIKSILGVSLVFMLSVMSSTASAVVSSTTVSGCSLYKKSLGQCSVFVDAILKGLGNTSLNPTAFSATLSNISGKVFCKNPAGNSTESNGTPFRGAADISLVGVDPIAPFEISRNGRSLADIDFHDPAIMSALDTAFPGVFVCQNSNWIRIPVIQSMEVAGQQLEDSDPTNPAGCNLNSDSGPFVVDTCDITDTLRTSCRIEEPYFTDPLAALRVNKYEYVCTEICHSTNPDECSLTNP